MGPTEITVSIASHGNNRLVNLLLADMAAHCSRPLTIIVTENVPDPTAVVIPPSPHRLRLTSNAQPKGYGANQNAAFGRCDSPYFCVSNPDIRLDEDPFPSLLECLAQGAAAVGPLVRSPAGSVEDSARRFPTVTSLLHKLVVRARTPDYRWDGGPIPVDWVAGMFMLFNARAFRDIGGFDEAYFLYYEDVDVCRRLWRSGSKVVYDPRVGIVHDAGRRSHRSLRFARHHAASMARYFFFGPR